MLWVGHSLKKSTISRIQRSQGVDNKSKTSGGKKSIESPEVYLLALKEVVQLRPEPFPQCSNLQGYSQDNPQGSRTLESVHIIVVKCLGTSSEILSNYGVPTMQDCLTFVAWLTHIHNAPGMMFLSERLYLWHLVYEPILKGIHEHLLLLDEIIEIFGPDVEKELFRRVYYYLSLLCMHSGTHLHCTLVFREIEECLMRLARLLFVDWVTEGEEGTAEPAPAYERD
ncbi:hypothetical protein OBBRIDRAFT_805952 [Obba rivulosa]|uniref:Uncharacterized protein n=1 Tax=Obba rivulosa TaxID=1052685 RepID=A0A8E2AVR9_9APHY|nr:hypothetical protein OBBRIDRAFT_805952 [Obba rivulosa]